MREEIRIEPGIFLAGHYIARVDDIAFAFHVPSGSTWHEIESIAAEKLKLLRDREGLPPAESGR